jgi:hypothetical protein
LEEQLIPLMVLDAVRYGSAVCKLQDWMFDTVLSPPVPPVKPK